LTAREQKQQVPASRLSEQARLQDLLADAVRNTIKLQQLPSKSKPKRNRKPRNGPVLEKAWND
jgi:hypothetical protein